MPLVYVQVLTALTAVWFGPGCFWADAQHMSTAARSSELDAAETKLWHSFQQFCLAAQGVRCASPRPNPHLSC
jgi:hypothetical protein